MACSYSCQHLVTTLETHFLVTLSDMRLLRLRDNDTVELTEQFGDNNIPDHAILSHRWYDDKEEPTFQEIEQG